MKTKQNDLKGLQVGVVSLGCDKNRIDTENMMTYLQTDGVNFVADPSDADIIIVNTCAFIKSSRDESYRTIEEMTSYRKTGRCTCLVVTGCFPQFRLNDLRNDFPEVDIFMGTNDYKQISDVIKKFYKDPDAGDIIQVSDNYNVDSIESGRVITTPSYFAYLKIADGCDNFCSYCLIPYIRGRYRSREFESVMQEARDLVENGAKEIILVAQDVAKYGEDLYKRNRLADLIIELSKLEKLKWIRLLYCYPEHLTDDAIDEIKVNPKVCAYVDIPFQHCNNDILKVMNRKVQKGDLIRLIEKLRKSDKDIAIRSTFILGFPGETKKEFNELIKFIKEYKMPNVGFFTYSREDGTVAGRLENQVDEITKKRRLLKAVKVQKSVVKQYNKSLIGKTVKVLFEGVDAETGREFGRSEYQAPDIDTITFITNGGRLKVGEFYMVTIDKVKGYDLYGHVEED